MNSIELNENLSENLTHNQLQARLLKYTKSHSKVYGKEIGKLIATSGDAGLAFLKLKYAKGWKASYLSYLEEYGKNR